MKRILRAMVVMGISMMVLVGCQNAKVGFDASKSIVVVSREDGSGTRGAFVELFEILEKGANDSKKDMTTKEAVITNKTDVMLTNISSNIYGIGYISLGSLNDSVKAVAIDGVSASTENIDNGTYSIVRPFNIVTKDTSNELAQDFISFIMSSEGWDIVAKSYIAVKDEGSYNGTNPAGKIVIAGSSSVTPIMEKLVEAYKIINTNAVIEIQTNDSSAGINAVVDGTCDIGMASRDLKDSETGLVLTTIAQDGIAVIVNNENPISGLTKEQVRSIFTGVIVNWEIE